MWHAINATIYSLPRLLSTTAPVPPTPASPAFAVEDYLVDACGLTRAQALSASTKIPHLKSPAKPDAVLAFLSGLGLSTADFAALVAKDPRFLCTGVETTLSPVVAGLTGLDLSHRKIARLVSLAPGNFCHTSVVSKLEYYLPLFGSIDNLLRPLKHGSGLLDSDLETVVKPNVKLLRECGLGARDIAKLLTRVPMLRSSKPECVLAMVACAEGIGVPRGSRMFRQALQAVSYFSEEKIAARVDYLKKTFRWSDAEVGIAVSKAPSLLRSSKKMLQRRSEFLISEAGLGPDYIAHRPNMLVLGVEVRLRPRYYVMKFLKENRLLKRDLSYNTIVKVTEKLFLEKFVCPHKEAAPHLAEDYATACRGRVPSRFIFT
ncbi:transcription termination factor MTERF15, mitochondrial-like [Triticum dicoccoides]|uniref:transcription termination factor MTERF15, mitochondrial-like n=1 Tax=Triticum dicoccoides TaxID=85692 RepID=UPI0018917AC9|nr:transcription termination factor MTERF15, mitochondrial-like [Triticum dicoccoides]